MSLIECWGTGCPVLQWSPLNHSLGGDCLPISVRGRNVFLPGWSEFEASRGLNEVWLSSESCGLGKSMIEASSSLSLGRQCLKSVKSQLFDRGAVVPGVAIWLDGFVMDDEQDREGWPDSEWGWLGRDMMEASSSLGLDVLWEQCLKPVQAQKHFQSINDD